MSLSISKFSKKNTDLQTGCFTTYSYDKSERPLLSQPTHINYSNFSINHTINATNGETLIIYSIYVS